jgi:hypothetical protein
LFGRKHKCTQNRKANKKTRKNKYLCLCSKSISMHSVAKMQLQFRNKFYVVADSGYAMRKQKQKNTIKDQLNICLIVASLIASTMDESALTPAGGVYQIRASDNNLNPRKSRVSYSFNSTIFTPRNVGKSVLSRNDFLFSISNILSDLT